MGVADQLAGVELPGRRSKATWRVVEKLSLPKDPSSGTKYSVGYRVQDERGRNAFMKVTDLDLLTDETCSIFERAEAAFQAHKFEREILHQCSGSNMDRVVVAIDYGDTIVNYDGGREPIFYLVFELAECDVRVQVDRRKRFDLAWSLSALHDLAVAIQQLHTGNVAHNDIKPANFLVFKDNQQRLGDLGRATSPLISAVHDAGLCVGDPRYAAPEILYACEEDAHLCSFSSRRASDIYHLGSMAYFLSTGRMLTPEVVLRLAPEHSPVRWQGSFAAVLPYWREAMTRVLEEFESQLPQLPMSSFSDIQSALFETDLRPPNWIVFG